MCLERLFQHQTTIASLQSVHDRTIVRFFGAVLTMGSSVTVRLLIFDHLQSAWCEILKAKDHKINLPLQSSGVNLIPLCKVNPTFHFISFA